MRTAREKLEDNISVDAEDIILIDDVDYCDALIGTTHDDRAVYDIDLMAKELMEKEGLSEDDAFDHIEFNIIRSLPYIKGKSPIIIYPFKM